MPQRQTPSTPSSPTTIRRHLRPPPRGPTHPVLALLRSWSLEHKVATASGTCPPLADEQWPSSCAGSWQLAAGSTANLMTGLRAHLFRCHRAALLLPRHTIDCYCLLAHQSYISLARLSGSHINPSPPITPHFPSPSSHHQRLTFSTNQHSRLLIVHIPNLALAHSNCH